MTEMDVADPGAGFSREAWSRNAGLYEAIWTMRFNAELAAGVLSEARFRHYITQDAHYLVGFGRALALAAAKAPHPDRIVQFAKGAEVAIVVERALHGSFFAQFAITPEMFAQTPLSPTCHHYVSDADSRRRSAGCRRADRRDRHRHERVPERLPPRLLGWRV